MEEPHGEGGVFLRIIEQPAHNRQRFRYACEGRHPEILLGENSRKKRRTFPSVEIVGYTGPAVVLVSCVEDASPFRVHPNEIIDRNGVSKGGVCHQEVDTRDMTCSYKNIGIQCIKRHDIPKSLSMRQSSNVDPFKQGFDHATSGFNPYVLRLCFQGFLKKGTALIPLDPVVSNIIADSRTHPIPHIHEISDDWSYSEGGKKIIILTNKVYKDDIEVHFTNDKNEEAEGSWNALGESVSIHKQHSIRFYTPPYLTSELSHPVKVYMYLYRPSLQHKSGYIEFNYLPTNLVNTHMKRKHPLESQGNELSSSSVLQPPKMVIPPGRGNIQHVVFQKNTTQQTSLYETNKMNSIDSLNLSDLVDLELSLQVDSNLILQPVIGNICSPNVQTTLSSVEETNQLGKFKTIENVFQFLNGAQ